MSKNIFYLFVLLLLSHYACQPQTDVAYDTVESKHINQISDSIIYRMNQLKASTDSIKREAIFDMMYQFVNQDIDYQFYNDSLLFSLFIEYQEYDNPVPTTVMLFEKEEGKFIPQSTKEYKWSNSNGKEKNFTKGEKIGGKVILKDRRYRKASLLFNRLFLEHATITISSIHFNSPLKKMKSNEVK